MSAANRYSMLTSRFGRLPFGRRFAVPLPDGTMTQGDRQQLGFAYRGILAGSPNAIFAPTRLAEVWLPGASITAVRIPAARVADVWLPSAEVDSE